MAESDWPGDELPPRERRVVAALVLQGWTYRYGDERFLFLTAPKQKAGEWWRVDRETLAPPEPAPRKEEPADTSTFLDRLKASVARHGVDLTDRTRRAGFTLSQVRSMVRQGYSARQVVDRTGWGGYWIADLVGPDGFYSDTKETG